MLIGAAQTLAYGSAAAGLTLLNRPERAAMLDRAARGLGKVFWTERFEPRFYGAAEVQRTETAAGSLAAASVRPA